MKKTLLFIFVFLLYGLSFAQEGPPIFKLDQVAVPPEFIGGDVAFEKYLWRNIKYPAKFPNRHGAVQVNFTVNLDGSISNVRLEKGIGGDSDLEAINLIQNMPNWKPGKETKNSSSSVRVYMQKTILFEPRNITNIKPLVKTKTKPISKDSI